MNIELLRKVVAYILEEPRRLDMGSWDRPVNPSFDWAPPCGTQACIAGTAAILTGHAMKVEENETIRRHAFYRLPDNVAEIAQKELGLTHQQACKLFLLRPGWDANGYAGSAGCWPDRFADEYEELPRYDKDTAMMRAKIVEARIERFIATNGTE